MAPTLAPVIPLRPPATPDWYVEYLAKKLGFTVPHTRVLIDMRDEYLVGAMDATWAASQP